MIKEKFDDEFTIAYKTKRGSYKELKVVALWYVGNKNQIRITKEKGKYVFDKRELGYSISR